MWRGELLADPEVYCEVVPTGTSLSGSSYPPPMGGSQHSPPPAVLPHFLADQAGHPRLFLSRRDDPALRRPAGDLEDEFGSDRLLEFFTVLDRHHERTRAPDDTVLVVEIEVVDVHRRIGRLLHHDWQAVDRNALLQRRFTRAGHGHAIVVGAIAGNIDDPP